MDGSEKHDISLAEAAMMTKNYRDQMTRTQVKGGYFSIYGLLKLMNQPECIGLRYYYGLNETGGQEIVLVGVDAAGNDIVDGCIAEMSAKCPPNCSTDNPLNS